jgi:hypothetical protein
MVMCFIFVRKSFECYGVLGLAYLIEKVNQIVLYFHRTKGSKIF